MAPWVGGRPPHAPPTWFYNPSCPHGVPRSVSGHSSEPHGMALQWGPPKVGTSTWVIMGVDTKPK